MRWLSLVALGACSTTTSAGGHDAASDSPTPRDASVHDAAPPDAYAARPCDAPAIFAEPFAPSRILHVSPGASNGDGSSAAPFGSIQSAAAVATPGTWILIAPGTHGGNQFIPNLRGTPTAPIWIGGAWGTMPVISGGAEGLHLTRPAYVVIQNLELANQMANAINIDDGVAHAGDTQSIAIVNVYAHDITATADSACIRASGVNGLAIYDSSARRCARGVVEIGVHGSVIARNVFDGTFTRGVIARAGSTDIDIRQNRFRNGGTLAIELGGLSAPGEFRPPLSSTSANAEARRVRAFNNFVVGDTGAPFAFNGCIDCVVAHNFVAGTPSAMVRVLQQTTAGGYSFEPTSNGRVTNNSFTWEIGNLSTYVEVNGNTSISTFTFSHNLWQSPPMLPVTEIGQVVNAFSGYTASTTVYCGGPESGAATPLPDIDGTLDGYCRANDVPTIGPQITAPGCGI
jgi:hypothetical protein